MRIVILGCGRVGAQLANDLDREGHSVGIVDKDPDSFNRRLSPDFGGVAVVGEGIDEDFLCRAGIETADVFAAVTNDDNVNIVASQIADLLFAVPKVICRIYDPIRYETYRTLGLNSISPTLLAATRIKELLQSYADGRQSASSSEQQGG